MKNLWQQLRKAAPPLQPLKPGGSAFLNEVLKKAFVYLNRLGGQGLPDRIRECAAGRFTNLVQSRLNELGDEGPSDEELGDFFERCFLTALNQCTRDDTGA